MTNADRIRNMTDEELADFLSEKAQCNDCIVNCDDKNFLPSLSSCYCRHLEWLQSDSEVQDE